MMRGLQIVESGKSIIENADGSFAVPSQTSSRAYEVRLIQTTWVCTCPDFEWRGVDACKHIFAVRLQIAAKTYLREEPKPKVLADDAVSCKKCGSIRVIKYGIDCGKQSYACKDCRARFVQDSLLKKAKFNPELVSLTLDLYFSGLSLRKIARNISDHFNIDLNYSTIYTWIQKLMPKIAEYVNTLTPQLSKTWHADELFVRVRGGTHQGKGVGFVWNIMDRESRFLIVSKLTTTRTAIDTVAAFEDAEQNAHGIKPDVVFTDSLRHYGSGMKVFPDAKRIENCGIAKRENNNRMERANGTLRERVKVQRGWKTAKTLLAEGNRIQYNFVRPHMSLDGKTPAANAGIGIADKDKWLAMIRAACEKADAK
jgi:transposase-like protein